MPLTPERISKTKDTTTLSSPVKALVEKNASRTKKPPPITPRRFRKFFNPRPVSSHRAVRTSRKALRDITTPGLNRKRPKKQSGPPSELSGTTSTLAVDVPPSSRKRRFSIASGISSVQSSPIKRAGHPPSSNQEDFEEETDGRYVASETLSGDEAELESEDEDLEEESSMRRRVPPIGQYRNFSTSTNLLSSRLSGRRFRKEAQNSKTWQDEVAKFYSRPPDQHNCRSEYGTFMTLPFSTTSCNTNSLVAIGDEEGGVRLVDSAYKDKDGFSKTFLHLRPHENAIMDMSFSSDDLLLATASGDQTARIMDVRSQRLIHCLTGHISSVKRILFQPDSNNNMVATCSRDGSVKLWDLRCAQTLRIPYQIRSGNTLVDLDPPTSVNSILSVDTIHHGHARLWTNSRKEEFRPTRDISESRDGVSVTSLAFLNSGREHLLLTGSEADATVKLWDMRMSYRIHRIQPLPISTTAEPSGHERHRRWGLTSIALSGDGARLYTLCRDHTIYTYSTAHLVLGDSHELSNTSSQPRRALGNERDGRGPLYGFRHPRLKVTTFYTKLAVRKARDDKSELLAVGSSDDCALIFPTDERYLTKSTRYQPPPPSLLENDNNDNNDDPTNAHTLPPASLRRHNTWDPNNRPSTTTFTTSSDTTLPIYTHGTPLIRGHNKEVTSLAWTTEGALVTVSDDFTARCWRDRTGVARSLRKHGEGGGLRWQCGWADMGEDGDSDDAADGIDERWDSILGLYHGTIDARG